MSYVNTVVIVFTFAFIRNLECYNDAGHKQNSRLNYFDTDLLRYSAEDRSGNVMVSPASIKSTLAMLLEGARGSTAYEIRSALRLSPNKDEFREQFNVYLSALQSNTTDTYLQNANAVFVSNKLKLKKEFEMLLPHVYFSEVCKMDFKDPVPASQTINAWVNKHTKGLITTIIEPVHVNPASEMLLVNALYFKSSWQFGFNHRLTRAGCFNVRGVCKTVAMMELEAELNYAYVDDLRAHAVELPYKDGRYSMILLVPQDRDGCANLIRDLPYMSLPQIYRLLEPTDIELAMPKFTVDYNEDIIGPLKNMRITSLFSTSANLSGIFEGESPQINNVFHKVHLSVDEDGTVAAAASGAMVIPLIESGVQLRVDRPFVFFIRDNNFGLVLFEGKIEDPTSYVEQNTLNGQSTPKNSRLIPVKRYFS